MNYMKKMCILRQIKQGFSGDGKPLSGLIKIEQYGKNLAIEVSIINFAPVASGEYYCLLSDGKGKTEMLKLRGKSIFNVLSDIDISGGFCGIVCYVKNEVVPIAYGINGNRSYDWRSILNATLPPVFPRAEQEVELAETVTEEEEEASEYDDEAVSQDNYFEEKEDASNVLRETEQNAHLESAAEKQAEKERIDETANGDAQSVRKPFQTDPDGYYLSVKGEIDALFEKYPTDETLCKAFSCSEWVRIKGTAESPEYLVGVVYDDGRAQYVCYALAAKKGNEPPEEIKEVCTFVPLSVFSDADGFFVIFQSAASGECIKPERA